VLVGTVRAAAALVQDFGAAGEDLIDQFWPGGLTLVCRASQSLVWDLGDTKGTVAVRMPLHAVTLDLLKGTGPLAVSSANRSGEPSATTAAEAEEQLGDSVAVYLDGGPCPGSVPSTIVDLTGTIPRLLRAGVVPIGQLREVIALAVTGDADEKVFSADERASRIIQEGLGAEGQASAADVEVPAADVEPSVADVEPPAADVEALPAVVGEEPAVVGEEPAVVDEEPAAHAAEVPAVVEEVTAAHVEPPAAPVEALGAGTELAGVDEEASSG
jgi:tRNA threonylcarbamoyl adenosine modification protein (Sua5/YciO/YrdC/YwlC family)